MLTLTYFVAFYSLIYVLATSSELEKKIQTFIRDGDASTLGMLFFKSDPTELKELVNREICGELTPLQYASKTNPTTIALLLEAGAIPNLAHRSTSTTPLMFAARSGELRAIDALLNVLSVDDVNAIDEHGSSALGLGSLGCNIKVAQKLIDAGANIYTIDQSGNTVLHIAAWYCADRGSEVGREYVSVLLKDSNGHIRKEASQRIDRLSNSGRTALMLAGKQGSTGVYDMLVSVGASMDVVSPHDGKTAPELRKEWESRQQQEKEF